MFENFFVVELANVLAGPSVGMFFAELGATVIKVEHPSGGDVTRSWKNSSEHSSDDISAYFSSVNWGKKSIAVDFSQREGISLVYDLLRKAHLVIVSFKPGDAEKFSLDYEEISSVNPGIIYGEITGYGENDERVGYDAILQAETGFMSMNGTPESGPVKMPVALIDVLAAHHLKEGILLALLEKNFSGRGKKISVSLYDAALSSLVNQAANYLVAGEIPQRIGSEHPNIAPYGTIFRTKDAKEIVLAVGTDAQFARLMKILGKEKISSEEKFSSNQKRVENRDELRKILSELIGNFFRDELLEKFRKEKIPAGAVNNLAEVFSQPPAKTMMLTEENFRGVSGIAFAHRKKKISPPPHFNEHVEEIVKAFLRYDKEKIMALRSKKIIV